MKNDFHFFYLRTVGLEFGFAEMEKSVRIRGMKLGLKMNEKYIRITFFSSSLGNHYL